MAYPFRIAAQLQYYIKREKCKVNDVIFPRAINLGNKNMKIGIFTGGTSVRSKNIFTNISLYPTGKHEIMVWIINGLIFFMPQFSLLGKKNQPLYVVWLFITEARLIMVYEDPMVTWQPYHHSDTSGLFVHSDELL